MAGLFGNPSAPGMFGGLLGNPDQMPQVPFRQNPVVTAIGSSLLAGPGMSGRYDMSSVGPALVAKTAMQGGMQKQKDAAAQKAKVSEAWNAVIRAKSTGQPPPPEAMSVLAESNPAIASKYFDTQFGGGGSPKTSLVPIWGEDAEGNPMLVQPTDTGEAVQTQLPDGFKPSKGIDKIDAGTEWLLYDKQTGDLVGRRPKDIAGTKVQEAIGEAQGDAIAGLPKTISTAEEMLSNIDTVRKQAKDTAALGDDWISGLAAQAAQVMPATEARGFVSRVNQLKGGLFLQAYQQLKGGGQITEIEGKKAEDAMARLDTATKRSDFIEALNDLEEVIRGGVARARQEATGVAPSPAEPEAAPPPPAAEWHDLGDGVRIRPIP